MSADLRLGRWQDVLQDVTCDALIVDAPYSERTHDGHAHDGTMREVSRLIRKDGRTDPPRPQGRRAVGAEMDPKHYEIARKRLAKGFTPPLFTEAPPAHEQLKMGDE